MKIIRMEAENFKGIKAIEIEPGGNPVVISGKNKAGKTGQIGIYIEEGEIVT